MTPKNKRITRKASMDKEAITSSKYCQELQILIFHNYKFEAPSALR